MKTKEITFTYATKAKIVALIKNDRATAVDDLKYKLGQMDDGTFKQLEDALEGNYMLGELRKPLRAIYDGVRLAKEVSDLPVG